MVAITGTPGVGKSSACRMIAERGHRVLALNREAEERGLVLGRDDAREAMIIDTDRLNEFVKTLQNDLVFLDGHLSHLLDCDAISIAEINNLSSSQQKERPTSN